MASGMAQVCPAAAAALGKKGCWLMRFFIYQGQLLRSASAKTSQLRQTKLASSPSFDTSPDRPCSPSAPRTRTKITRSFTTSTVSRTPTQRKRGNKTRPSESVGEDLLVPSLASHQCAVRYSLVNLLLLPCFGCAEILDGGTPSLLSRGLPWARPLSPILRGLHFSLRVVA